MADGVPWTPRRNLSTRPLKRWRTTAVPVRMKIFGPSDGRVERRARGARPRPAGPVAARPAEMPGRFSWLVSAPHPAGVHGLRRSPPYRGSDGVCGRLRILVLQDPDDAPAGSREFLIDASSSRNVGADSGC